MHYKIILKIWRVIYTGTRYDVNLSRVQIVRVL